MSSWRQGLSLTRCLLQCLAQPALISLGSVRSYHHTTNNGRRDKDSTRRDLHSNLGDAFGFMFPPLSSLSPGCWSSWLLFSFSREFARWKVNNLALERKDFFSLPLPLAPEFIRNIRLLGRRPSLQQITENLIKKYGTHFLLSATLGGKCHVCHPPAAFSVMLRGQLLSLCKLALCQCS